MPKGSPELVAARRAEIVEACARLYDSLPFGDITIGMIGAGTTLSRASVYNYFRTKEEIFLALLGREYEAWTADLDALAARPVPREEFADAFAAVLQKRGRLLKLVSMNLYDMEAGSSVEELTEFKRRYNASIRAVLGVLKTHFPASTEEDGQEFVYSFFPFLFGVYPYTSVTPKQVEAMRRAGVAYRQYSPREIVRLAVEKLTAALPR